MSLRGGHPRSVGAVGVGAAVRGVLAALPSHPVPHLHSDAGLGAPPDGTPELLGPTVCLTQVDADSGHLLK